MELFTDFIPSLNEKKEHLLNKDVNAVKYYEKYSFRINKNYSMDKLTVLFANEMNKYWELPYNIQYDFFFYGLPKAKRYTKWYKTHRNEDMDIVKRYFDYTEEKAKAALDLLTKDQLEEIRQFIAEQDE